MYLAANLRLHGHDVSILDPTIEAPKKMPNGTYYYGIMEKDLKEKITNYEPDVIGISCHYAFSHQGAYRIAVLAKTLNPKIVTIIGGLFPTIYKEKVLSDCQSLDYLLIGESEQTLPLLLSELSSHGSAKLEAIDGLIYRKDNKIVNNGKKSFIDNLDSLPYPARDLVDIKRYMNTKTVLYGLGAQPALSLLTSRSCPNRCSFCNMWLIHGSRWRPRSPDNVLGEIDEIVNKYQARHVFIMDDNFTFDPERVKVICNGIIQKGYRFSWNTPDGISVKKIDAELARLMKRAGCSNVCIGIESGSEDIRNRLMKKNVSDQEIINAIKHFNSAKIPVGAFIILGMPGENKTHFQETINFLKRLNLSFVIVTFAIPFPGTELYANLIQEGIIPAGYIPMMDNFNYPLFLTKDFSRTELLERRKKLLIQFYSSHIPKLIVELFQGRLNWITPSMLQRVFVEKIVGNWEKLIRPGGLYDG